MAINFPGPYEVRLFYTIVTREHVMKLNCDVISEPSIGDPFSSIDLVTRLGAGRTAQDAVDDLVALLVPFYDSANANFGRAEFWKYDEGTFDASYVSAYTIDVDGTSGLPTIPASQYILTFRTQEGGYMKLSLMDSVVTSGLKITPPYGAGTTKNLTDEFLSSTNVWLARDTSYPVANISGNPGINEALFKKIYR